MAAPLVPSAPVGYGNSRRLAGDARDGRLRHLGRNNMERLFEEGTPQEKFECEEIVIDGFDYNPTSYTAKGYFEGPLAASCSTCEEGFDAHIWKLTRHAWAHSSHVFVGHPIGPNHDFRSQVLQGVYGQGTPARGPTRTVLQRVTGLSENTAVGLLEQAPSGQVYQNMPAATINVNQTINMWHPTRLSLRGGRATLNVLKRLTSPDLSEVRNASGGRRVGVGKMTEIMHGSACARCN